MEKEQAVELLKNDLEGFNKWKRDNPRKQLDLSGVDLAGANLQGAQLGQANLSGANLRGVNLTSAMLAAVDLSNADLTDADLTGSNLHRASFKGTNLHNTKLGGLKEEGRMCLTTSSFDGVSWGKEQLEEMLEIINLNADWTIQYQIVPK